ncbi:MAG: MBOAT family protein, partial [Myxococcota bacterium]
VTSAGRWGLGVAGFYVLFEAVDRFVQAGYRAIGLEIGPAQRTPLAARTVAEFWGRRWNAIVHRWLASVAFFPLARRGHVALAGLAAFALSAAIHTYLVIPGVGLAAGLRMGAFFVVQGLLVVIERALGIARAPAWVGHAWTVACFVATVPLFIEPFLRLAGFPPLP